MLAALGFGTIAVLLLLAMTKRASVLVALILLPALAALIGGFAGDLGELILGGLSKVPPTGIVIAFVVLCRCLMVDAGLFDPLIHGLSRAARDEPLRITAATALGHRERNRLRALSPQGPDTDGRTGEGESERDDRGTCRFDYRRDRRVEPAGPSPDGRLAGASGPPIPRRQARHRPGPAAAADLIEHLAGQPPHLGTGMTAGALLTGAFPL
ncbi:hypothetical protein ACIRD9_10480 [Streptomyces violaceus]|uniref:hypothetical protein n=1 Tax=Streptomyces violaceus TaxID=1936 RepID=UPI00382346C0